MYYLRWSILSDHDGRSKMRTTTEAEEAVPFIAVDGRALRFGPSFISLRPIFVEVGEEYGGERAVAFVFSWPFDLLLFADAGR